MSEMKHTPTPWKVSRIDSTVVVDALGREVAAIYGDYNHPDEWPIMEATAALIVRAVNSHEAMLAALKMVMKFIDRDCPTSEAATLHARCRVLVEEGK